MKITDFLIIGVGIVTLAFIGVVITVAAHFIAKAW